MVRHITGLHRKAMAMFAETGHNVTRVTKHHITGRLGMPSRNVTHGTGESAALTLDLGHITFAPVERRIEPAARGAQPLHPNTNAAPSLLELGLLPLLHPLIEVQIAAVTEAQSNVLSRHDGGVYALVAEGGFAGGCDTSV